MSQLSLYQPLIHRDSQSDRFIVEKRPPIFLTNDMKNILLRRAHGLQGIGPKIFLRKTIDYDQMNFVIMIFHQSNPWCPRVTHGMILDDQLRLVSLFSSSSGGSHYFDPVRGGFLIWMAISSAPNSLSVSSPSINLRSCSIDQSLIGLWSAPATKCWTKWSGSSVCNATFKNICFVGISRSP